MRVENKSKKVVEFVSSKPEVGKPLGKFRFTFRYLDATAIEYKGFVRDVTGLFCNPGTQKDFRVLLKKELESKNLFKADAVYDVADLDRVDESALVTAFNLFDKFSFGGCFRVLLLEHFVTHQKHLIFQTGRLQNITDYAVTIDAAQWSLVKGVEYDFLVSGKASTFADAQKLRGLGEVFIHVFVPDDVSSDASDFPKVEDALVTAKLLSVIPQSVDVDQVISAKNEIIKGKDDTITNLKAQLEIKSTEVDAAKIAVAGHQRKGKSESLAPKKVDFFDFFLITGATLVIGGIASSLVPSFGWFAGVTIGLLAGFAAVYKRR